MVYGALITALNLNSISENITHLSSSQHSMSMPFYAGADILILALLYSLLFLGFTCCALSEADMRFNLVQRKISVQ